MDEIIKMVDLSKSYGDSIAVDQINLTIKEGEIFGFLGLNGAGKTSTLLMLLGMIRPTSGSCYIQNEKVSSVSSPLNWNDIGYLVEETSSYPELTVRENLEIILKLRGINEKKRVDWIIKKLNLKKYEYKKAKELSLGNNQRLGLAKALIHQPKILILDEPTNGLDPSGVVEIRKLLLELSKNTGVTILISSHHLSEISKIASTIAIIHYGKLLKKLTLEQLEGELERSLLVNGIDREKMEKVLSESGYQVNLLKDDLSEKDYCLQITDKSGVNSPEKVVTQLVAAGVPPNFLKVERENLESYFLRIINESVGEI